MNPISYSEMKAWSELTGNTITPFESQAIKMLDNLLIEKQGQENG